MRVCSSKRERRIWTWTAIVACAIFASLGLTGWLAEALGDSDLIPGAFALGMLLLAATIVTQGLQSRPSGPEIAIVLGVSAALFMLLLRFALSERTHLIEFGVLAAFIHAALKERASQGRRVPAVALIAVLAATAIGLLDEGIQAILPNRIFDPQDLPFNFLAAVTAVGVGLAVGWARRRVRT